jgi:hypothetical protein
MIAPAFFKHADLYDAEVASALPLRVAFAGLWTVADRRGVFPWSRNVKPDVLPYDPCDMMDVLEALAAHGFVLKYEVEGKWYGCVPTMGKHQHFHKYEKASTLPAPGEHGAATVLTPVERSLSTTPDGRLTTSDIRHTEKEPSAPVATGTAKALPTFHVQPYLAATPRDSPVPRFLAGGSRRCSSRSRCVTARSRHFRRWLIFLPAKGELGPEYFARTWSEWDHPPPPALARNGAKPTAAEQMTASMSRIFTPAPKPSGRSP